MSAILRLYPPAWRERYGDELVALLEEHPASPLDHLDLIRGAIDARLHPQVQGTDVSPEQEIPMNQKQLGVVAAIGGIVWILAVVSVFVLPRQADGYRDVSLAAFGLALGIAMTGIALGELGTRQGSPISTRTGHVVAVIGVALGGLMLTPWPFFVIGLVGFPVLGVVAAVRGAMNGALPGWFVILFAVASVASITGSMGDIGNSDVGPLLIGVVGLAALVLAGLAFSHQRNDTPEVSLA